MKSSFHFISFFIVLLFAACTAKDHKLLVQFEGESYKKTWAITELNPALPSDWSFRGLGVDFSVECPAFASRQELNLYTI